MRRALNRAGQRLRGQTPRRRDSRASRLAHLATDGLLASAGLAALGGLALVVWGVAAGFEPVTLAAGGGLVLLAPALLYLWEKVAWEPFIKHLSELG